MRIARKSWQTPMIQTRSSRSAPCSTPNRNSCSSLFSEKIWMFFAWKISDMPGILMEVIEHKLGIDPAFKPIRQKKRLYTPERCEAITQEFHRLLEVGFIRPVDYPS
jgi:hypothetical protein